MVLSFFWTGSDPHSALLEHQSIHIHTMVLFLLLKTIYTTQKDSTYLIYHILCTEAMGIKRWNFTKNISSTHAFAKAIDSIHYAALVSLC